jgi:hypothetical protein
MLTPFRPIDDIVEPWVETSLLWSARQFHGRVVPTTTFDGNVGRLHADGQLPQLAGNFQW